MTDAVAASGCICRESAMPPAQCEPLLWLACLYRRMPPYRRGSARCLLNRGHPEPHRVLPEQRLERFAGAQVLFRALPKLLVFEAADDIVDFGPLPAGLRGSGSAR
jgi:hypothetical protein